MSVLWKKVRREGLNLLLITGGILSAGMGLKGFLLSSHFIDGGVTGVSMLLANVLAFSLCADCVIIFPLFSSGIGRLLEVRAQSAFGYRRSFILSGVIKYPDVTPISF